MTRVPAEVWVGSRVTLKHALGEFLQQQFCRQGGCKNCVICHQIQAEQFYNCLWLTPQGSYKIDQIRLVLERLSFKLALNEKFYFIFQQAQYLSAAIENSLLKSIEEPPIGYHFVFLVPRKEVLLPTILSRAILKNFYQADKSCEHSLIRSLTLTKLSPMEMQAVFEEFKELTDEESVDLFDEIYAYWLQQSIKAPEDKTNLKILQVLEQAQINLPVSGSSKLFWRNLYLQLS